MRELKKETPGGDIFFITQKRFDKCPLCSGYESNVLSLFGKDLSFGVSSLDLKRAGYDPPAGKFKRFLWIFLPWMIVMRICKECADRISSGKPIEPNTK
jgi:hypothetical protein